MAEIIYTFLVNIIGDIPINETTTLMQLISYISTFLITCILISPILVLTKNVFRKKVE